jgi:hypothetical protein
MADIVTARSFLVDSGRVNITCLDPTSWIRTRFNLFLFSHFYSVGKRLLHDGSIGTGYSRHSADSLHRDYSSCSTTFAHIRLANSSFLVRLVQFSPLLLALRHVRSAVYKWQSVMGWTSLLLTARPQKRISRACFTMTTSQMRTCRVPRQMCFTWARKISRRFCHAIEASNMVRVLAKKANVDIFVWLADGMTNSRLQTP